MHNEMLRHVHANTVVVEKQIYIKHCKCVFVALGIEHASRVHRIVICCLPGSGLFIYSIS